MKLNEPAPDFTGPAIDISRDTPEFTFKLSDFQGRPVVLAFYPGDFTPVCTKEMCDFSDNLSSFNELNATVAGISTDSIDKHREFAQKYKLNFPLVADTESETGRLYNVQGPLFSKAHRRAIFVIDAEGRLIWQKVEVTALFRTAAKEIAEVIRQL